MATRHIVLLIILAIVAAVATWIGMELHWQFACSDFPEQNITGPADLDVQIVGQVCSSETELVYLANRRSGRRLLTFSYYPTSPGPIVRAEDTLPRVRWLDSHHL